MVISFEGSWKFTKEKSLEENCFAGFINIDLDIQERIQNIFGNKRM